MLPKCFTQYTVQFLSIFYFNKLMNDLFSILIFLIVILRCFVYNKVLFTCSKFTIVCRLYMYLYYNQVIKCVRKRVRVNNLCTLFLI